MGPRPPGARCPSGRLYHRAPREARVPVAGSGARSAAARLTPEVHAGVGVECRCASVQQSEPAKVAEMRGSKPAERSAWRDGELN